MKVYSAKRCRTQLDSELDEAFNEPELPRKRVRAAAIPSRKLRCLTQMTIDLGGSKLKQCPVCKMEYIASSVEDSKLHKQFHSLENADLNIPAKLVRNATFMKTTPMTLDRVIEVSNRDAAPLRRIASRILEVAEKELGAVKTSKVDLWERHSHSAKEIAGSQRIFLYVYDRICLGLCLVKRIRQGKRVLPPRTGSDPAVIEVSNELFSASLGVSRIWVSQPHRRKNIATQLLDACCISTLGGVGITKDEVAFSQPTMNGAALARKWHGKVCGWLVFDEDPCYNFNGGNGKGGYPGRRLP